MVFDGVWKRVVKTSKGPQDFDLTLHTRREGITGSISGQGMEAAIEGGPSAADNVTWKYKLTQAHGGDPGFPRDLEGHQLLSSCCAYSQSRIFNHESAGKVKFGMFGSVS